MSDDKKEEGLEIEIQEEVVEEVKEEAFDIEGLSEGEVEMAKEQGLYDPDKKEEEEDGKHEEQPETKTEDSKEEEEVNKDPDNFEEIDEVFTKDEKSFHEKFSPNQKALYFKNKASKKKLQALQKEFEDYKADGKDTSGSQAKIDKIAKLLANTEEELTVEMLKSVLDTKEETEVKKDGPIKPEIMQEMIRDKASFAEQIGKAKYGDKFEAISNLTKEVLAEDKSGNYQQIIDNAFLDPNTDETMLAETVVRIAKLSPKFEEITDKVASEKKEKVDRAIKNSKKKVSSSSVSGSAGKRIISEDELTCDQVSHKAKTMSTKAYDKFWDSLKEDTRTRIMKGIDP